MSCIYSDNEGHCTMWDENQDAGSTYEDCEMGWDGDGFCVCEDDPDPHYSCAQYEGHDEIEEWGERHN